MNQHDKYSHQFGLYECHDTKGNIDCKIDVIASSAVNAARNYLRHNWRLVPDDLRNECFFIEVQDKDGKVVIVKTWARMVPEFQFAIEDENT